MLERWLGVAAAESVEPDETAVEALIHDARSFDSALSRTAAALHAHSSRRRSSCEHVFA